MSHCSQHNVAFIVDEVQSGVLSSGTFWAHEQWGLDDAPDIVTFAKKMQVGVFSIPVMIRFTYAHALSLSLSLSLTHSLTHTLSLSLARPAYLTFDRPVYLYQRFS